MKKLLALALGLALLTLPVLSGAEAMETVKDETVYALLTSGGALRETLVVSHIDTPEAGVYTDHGAYATVQSLLTEAMPTIDGDTITWDLPADPAGFYALGTMEDAQLPYTFAIEYRLEGAVIVPEALPGLGGHVEMKITATPNPGADEGFAGRYMAQIQVPLSIAMAANIDAPSATSSLVGQMRTLAYTVLPGQSATFTLSFDTEAFEMDSITIACMPVDLSDMLGMDIGGLVDQAAALEEGAQTLADGGAALSAGLGTLAESTQALTDGLAALPGGIATAASGIQTLSDALAALPGQVTPLAEGSASLAEGVGTYTAATGAVLDGVTALSAGLDTLSTEGATMAASIGQLQSGLAPLVAQLPQAQQAAVQAQLEALAAGLTAYTEGVTAVATQVSGMTEGIAQLKESGTALASGVQQQSEGIAALQGGLTAMATEAAALPEGMTALASGATEGVEGLAALNTAVQALPGQAQQLADGQQAMADGLVEALTALDAYDLSASSDEAVVSFASPAHAARTVQFVYRTDAISIPAAEEEAPAPAAAESFWDRLTGLFK